MKLPPPNIPHYLANQVFVAPLLMMLRYRGISSDDPQLLRWIHNKLGHSKDLSHLGLKRRVAKHRSRDRHKSTRLIRSLAKKLRLAGDRSETTRTREFCLFLYDYQLETKNFFLAHSGAYDCAQQQAFDRLLRPSLDYFLPILSSSLDCHKSGFILKSGLSYVDFIFADQLQRLKQVDPELLSDYPELMRYKCRVFKFVLEGDRAF